MLFLLRILEQVFAQVMNDAIMIGRNVTIIKQKIRSVTIIIRRIVKELANGGAIPIRQTNNRSNDDI